MFDRGSGTLIDQLHLHVCPSGSTHMCKWANSTRTSSTDQRTLSCMKRCSTRERRLHGLYIRLRSHDAPTMFAGGVVRRGERDGAWEEMAEANNCSHPDAVIRQERAVPGTSGLWCVAVVRIPRTRTYTYTYRRETNMVPSKQAARAHHHKEASRSLLRVRSGRMEKRTRPNTKSHRLPSQAASHRT